MNKEKMSGALLSPKDERDYPICMAYEDNDSAIPEAFTTSFQPPYAKQISGNCVAQTIANIMEVMYHNMVGRHEDFSVGFVYGNRTQYEHDGEGMTGRMACDHLVEDGNVKSEVFDNDCEAPGIIRAVKKFKEQFPNWKDFTYVPIRYVRTKKADEVKKFIMRYNIPVLAVVETKYFYWAGGYHAMALYGWEGDTAIMQNSWGDDWKPIVKVDFKNIEEFWLIVPFEIANFTDLTDEHWAYESIIKCVDKKILTGYPDGTFAPDKELTRAELAVLIYRMMKGE